MAGSTRPVSHKKLTQPNPLLAFSLLFIINWFQESQLLFDSDLIPRTGLSFRHKISRFKWEWEFPGMWKQEDIHFFSILNLVRRVIFTILPFCSSQTNLSHLWPLCVVVKVKKSGNQGDNKGEKFETDKAKKFSFGGSLK